MLPRSIYFSFQFLESSLGRRVLMQLGGVLLLPLAAALWLLPFRLACFNFRAFGHLCLEPFLLRIDGRVRARVFGLAGEKIANRPLYEFLKTQYPILERRYVINLLSIIYSWRFLQVDVGCYFYSKKSKPPEYRDVYLTYGNMETAHRYRKDFLRFIGCYKKSPSLVEFFSKVNSRYVILHWRHDDSKKIHRIRNSRGYDLIETINMIIDSGYGVCVAGDGYERDSSYDAIRRIEGVFFLNSVCPADPLADLWVMANADFGVFGESGISSVMALLEIPSVVHNFVPAGLGPLHPSWIVRRKILRWKSSGRSLDVEDLRHFNLDYIADWRVCEKNGIEAFDCSSKEIKDAVQVLISQLSMA